MSGGRWIGAEERRARIGVRHRLAASHRAATAEETADAVVGLHATDAATVFLSAGARLTSPAVTEVERALYEDVTLVRLLCMRRTMFAVSGDLAPVVEASHGRAIAAKERATLVRHLTEWNTSLDAAWLADAERATLSALDGLGEATGSELSATVPALRQKITVFPGTSSETMQGVATRVLRCLAADGRIRRSRPRGAWTSSQFRWVPAEPLPALPEDEAKAELARRWLASYGPATEADLAWWTGWTLGATREVLNAVGTEEVRIDEGTGLVLPGDDAPAPEVEPWAALLPGLDPTAMGRRHRAWFLADEHRPPLFDRSGNVGPTVWWNGEVIGGWAQRPDGEIVWRLFTDRGRAAAEAVEREAARLADWTATARITPRFRTPLERELAA
ncbi:winged helix DNA-binding domain-containing protein [Streptomyces sp. NPDC048639]|uniref:winged helix DNA-binding domain-containing protein n=1 Tax=Streptomyces sp. NPDC048639 TaxID=3365581 RepID=UPI003710C4EB